MELKEYLEILRKRIDLFLGVVLVFLLAGTALKIFQPVRWEAEVVLNVTRSGQEETADYRFDGFYRLQADERFADTAVRWLGTARMQEDIQNTAGKKMVSLEAKRLSSQLIVVEVVAKDAPSAEKISGAIPQILNQEAQKLNQWQKEKNWFMVVADEPTISRSAWEWDRTILISLLFGIFAAFWSVVISHYFAKK
jgi:capsular polysaccharide biosynthesis protein